ncbi:MAG TPA: hypothetical protein DCO86_02745 [Spirochaetaceae bacterium]|nr:hypothetical protein [Spirochaetaceae bacterium]
MKKFFVLLILLLICFASCDNANQSASGANNENEPNQGSSGGNQSGQDDGSYGLASFDDVSVLVSALSSSQQLPSVKSNGSDADSGAVWKIESSLDDDSFTLSESGGITASRYGAAVVSAQISSGEKAFLSVSCLPSEAPKDKCLVFMSSKQFVFTTSNSKKNWNGKIEFSIDGANWTEWNERDEGGEEMLAPIDSGKLASDDANYYVFVRGTGNDSITGWKEQDPNGFIDFADMPAGFKFSAKNAADGNIPIYCFGDIRALLNYSDASGAQMADGAFYGLFSECQGLVNSPELPFGALRKYCYSCMFSGKHNKDFDGNVIEVDNLFAVPPILPATELAEHCYDNMFANCFSMQAAPVLPADTLEEGCYYSMFGNCISLKTPPRLPATKLAPSCYEIMFNECRSLEALPQLPTPDPMPKTDDMCTGCMFAKCDRIRISETKTGEYVNEITFPYESYYADLSGRSALDSKEGEGEPMGFITMFADTGGTFTGNPKANRKYYTSNKVI